MLMCIYTVQIFVFTCLHETREPSKLHGILLNNATKQDK